MLILSQIKKTLKIAVIVLMIQNLVILQKILRQINTNINQLNQIKQMKFVIVLNHVIVQS